MFLDQRFCDACWARRRRATQTCPGCGQTKVLAFYDEHQRPACTSCTGNTSSFGCNNCGREDNVFGACCATCTLADRLTTLLADTTSRVHPQLQPVYDALLAGPRPQTTLYWLTRRSARPDILVMMARGEIAISHTAFYDLPCNRNVNYVRDLLTATGVLPPYQPLVARIPSWLRALLDAEPKHRADLVHRFARWHALRRLHMLGDRVTRGSVLQARNAILSTIKFLTWLDDHDTELADLTQAMLDDYLLAHPGHAAMLRPFIEWTARTALTSELELPKQPTTQPEVMLSDEQRWDHVETLIHDNTIHLYARIGGLFMLLFAQPVARICRMRANQITIDSDIVTVTFDTEPIELPAPLDQLVRDHLNRPGWASYVSRPNTWLFPGGVPGKHLTTETMRSRLVSRGIHPNHARKAALFQLAATMPVPVLADLLGLDPNTAVRWAALSARDWGQYTAIRRETDMPS
ncbi:hypothetical protein [Nocardia sp. CY41]|uniref:hypothetical protein n=1 Tax=Nocardia sp. CY41 TaxID=2608686 RepID=UPI001915C8BD|nr:hypothetical protein [Nocardia sp. CY41]